MKSVEYRKAIEKMRKETQSVFTKTSIKVTLADFELLRVLGRGAFGKVNHLSLEQAIFFITTVS